MLKLKCLTGSMSLTFNLSQILSSRMMLHSRSICKHQVFLHFAQLHRGKGAMSGFTGLDLNDLIKWAGTREHTFHELQSHSLNVNVQQLSNEASGLVCSEFSLINHTLCMQTGKGSGETECMCRSAELWLLATHCQKYQKCGILTV